jgi:NADP-reducing hydrogenase subunit HndD
MEMVILNQRHAREVPPGHHHSGGRPQAGIRIPTLCYLKEINEIGACRICVVEVRRPQPAGRLRAARVQRGHGGAHTNTPQGAGARKMTWWS